MKRGFAFSFDAFVAFILSMAVIATLFIFVNLPSGYYADYEQMYLIGQDAIQTMEDAYYDEDTTHQQKLIEEINAGGDDPCYFLRENFIPKQYAFRLETYNVSSDDWEEECNLKRMQPPTNAYTGCDDYTKMKVTLPFVINSYSEVPDNSEMQYGYGECDGNWTPCATPVSMFEPGEMENELLRLVICV